MSELVIILLVSVIAGKELLRAYYGPERPLEGRLRWLNPAIGVLALVFILILIQQVLFVLKIY